MKLTVIESIWGEKVEIGYNVRVRQSIANQMIKKLRIIVYSAKYKNGIKVEIEKLNGEKTIASFQFEPTDYHENFHRVLIFTI